MKKNTDKKYFPTFVKPVFILLVLSIFIYILAINNAVIADFVNDTIGVAFRVVLSFITYIFPFSVFEMMLVLLPVILVALTVVFIKGARSLRSMVRVTVSLLAVVSIIATSYIFTLGVGYRTIAISDKIGIEDRADITVQELYQTTVLVRDELNELALLINEKDGESVMPYSFDDLNKKIVDAYDSMNDKYNLLTNFTSRAKPIYFSTVMSDLRIGGIYSFFTGEANVNMEYPDYNLPFTVAHELAHQRGIGRENEANFVAFLVCIASDDVYVRYSGYLNLYEYLSSALYRADKDLYSEMKANLCELAIKDIAASNAVYNAHKDSILGELNDKANDTYLKLNGTQGTVTYGYVVRLAVGYYTQRSSSK